jgi:hypothetical protein
MATISKEMMKSTETVRKPATVAMPDEVSKNIPAHEPWLRRIENARKTTTEPRDLFENDSVWRVDMPPEVKAHIRVNWLSDWIIQHKPIMPGFVYESWSPVTPEVMKDFQITVHTETRTAEGVPKIGLDAVLYWCLEEHAKQMDEYQRRGAHIGDKLKTERRRMKEQMGGMLIGDVKTGTQEEIAEMETEQRKELGASFNTGGA